MNLVVTGPSADGLASIVRSEVLAPLPAMAGSKNETRLCWATSGFPYDRVETLAPGTLMSPGAGETRFLFVTFAANSKSPMHATPTIDYVVVVAGELWLIMEDGQERRLVAGDSVVQRGTLHAWENRSAQPCTIAATMIGAGPKAPIVP